MELKRGNHEVLVSDTFWACSCRDTWVMPLTGSTSTAQSACEHLRVKARGDTTLRPYDKRWAVTIAQWTDSTVVR